MGRTTAPKGRATPPRPPRVRAAKVDPNNINVDPEQVIRALEVKHAEDMRQANRQIAMLTAALEAERARHAPSPPPPAQS